MVEPVRPAGEDPSTHATENVGWYVVVCASHLTGAQVRLRENQNARNVENSGGGSQPRYAWFNMSSKTLTFYPPIAVRIEEI